LINQIALQTNVLAISSEVLRQRGLVKRVEAFGVVAEEVVVN